MTKPTWRGFNKIVSRNSFSNMPKEMKPEIPRLSRFFQDNLDIIRKKNEVTDFEVSPYFLNATKEKTNVEEKKKKKVKKKPLGPQFKGFSRGDRDSSAFKKIEMEQAVTQNESRIKEVEHFPGFTAEEIKSSNILCDRVTYWSRYFEKRRHHFRGFSKLDQTKSLSEITNLLEACDGIRTNIYKNIDRRVLTNHIEENSQRDKIVCSRYWWQNSNLPLKEEDKTWKRDDLVGKSYLSSNKNGIKSENVKTDISALEREHVILLEIQKLNEELRRLRKIKYAASEEVTLQSSAFIQIKKELIITQFVPPKSPHYLLEEELYHDPWALLVATIFLNKTSARSARPYVFWFLEENPDPLTVIGKRTEELETYFGVLGLQKTRATQVWRMSHDFLYKEWKKVGELYGIGRYAEDAFRMFCLGDFSAEPKDRYLKIYKAWYAIQEEKSRLREMNN